MTAHNIVRMRVKPGCEQDYIDRHNNMSADRRNLMKSSGLRQFTIVKTGEREFTVMGEWDSFDSIVAARPAMIEMLDEIRPLLEDLGDGKGVTDPVSGEAVVRIS
jgi:L-rhamnose mutarotase